MLVRKQYSEYIGFLEKYRDELVLALTNESEKRQALIDNDLERLEAMLQLQQAETMKLKSFEHKRLAIQEELGFEDYKAKEIVEAVDDSKVGERLGNLFKQIADLAVRIKKQNAMTIERAGENLKMLDAIVRSDYDSNNNIYGPESGKNQTYSKEPAFEKMV